jgi:hypothetical protein
MHRWLVCHVHGDLRGGLGPFWRRYLGAGSGRLVPKRRVRAHRVVVLAPAFDDDPHLGQRVEDFPVQQFVVQLAVAALTIAVFPGTSGLDKRRVCTHRGNPLPYGLGDEFRTVVRADMARCPAQDEQAGQHIDHVRRLQLPGNPDDQAFARELVDHVQHAQLPTIMGPPLHEVIGPDMVGPLRTQVNAGPVIQPEPPLPGLPVRHLQPLLPPDPLHALHVYRPASGPQQRRDPAVSMSAILRGQRDNAPGQSHIIGSRRRALALRRSVLPQTGDTRAEMTGSTNGCSGSPADQARRSAPCRRTR